MAHPNPKHPVSISIRRQSNSPVYVAGTFSDPPWELFELTAEPLELEKSSEDLMTPGFIFSRDFKLPEGRYQYKFREGEGGDWFLDSKAEHETSAEGSTYNLLSVIQSSTAAPNTEDRNTTISTGDTVNGDNSEEAAMKRDSPMTRAAPAQTEMQQHLDSTYKEADDNTTVHINPEESAGPDITGEKQYADEHPESAHTIAGPEADTTEPIMSSSEPQGVENLTSQSRSVGEKADNTPQLEDPPYETLAASSEAEKTDLPRDDEVETQRPEGSENNGPAKASQEVYVSQLEETQGAPAASIEVESLTSQPTVKELSSEDYALAVPAAAATESSPAADEVERTSREAAAEEPTLASYSSDQLTKVSAEETSEELLLPKDEPAAIVDPMAAFVQESTRGLSQTAAERTISERGVSDTGDTPATESNSRDVENATSECATRPTDQFSLQEHGDVSPVERPATGESYTEPPVAELPATDGPSEQPTAETAPLEPVEEKLTSEIAVQVSQEPKVCESALEETAKDAKTQERDAVEPSTDTSIDGQKCTITADHTAADTFAAEPVNVEELPIADDTAASNSKWLPVVEEPDNNTEQPIILESKPVVEPLETLEAEEDSEEATHAEAVVASDEERLPEITEEDSTEKSDLEEHTTGLTPAGLENTSAPKETDDSAPGSTVRELTSQEECAIAKPENNHEWPAEEPLVEKSVVEESNIEPSPEKAEGTPALSVSDSSVKDMIAHELESQNGSTEVIEELKTEEVTAESGLEKSEGAAPRELEAQEKPTEEFSEDKHDRTTDESLAENSPMREPTAGLNTESPEDARTSMGLDSSAGDAIDCEQESQNASVEAAKETTVDETTSEPIYEKPEDMPLTAKELDSSAEEQTADELKSETELAETSPERKEDEVTKEPLPEDQTAEETTTESGLEKQEDTPALVKQDNSVSDMIVNKLETQNDLAEAPFEGEPGMTTEGHVAENQTVDELTSEHVPERLEGAPPVLKELDRPTEELAVDELKSETELAETSPARKEDEATKEPLPEDQTAEEATTESGLEKQEDTPALVKQDNSASDMTVNKLETQNDLAEAPSEGEPGMTTEGHVAENQTVDGFTSEHVPGRSEDTSALKEGGNNIEYTIPPGLESQKDPDEATEGPVVDEPISKPVFEKPENTPDLLEPDTKLEDSIARELESQKNPIGVAEGLAVSRPTAEELAVVEPVLHEAPTEESSVEGIFQIKTAAEEPVSEVFAIEEAELSLESSFHEDTVQGQIITQMPSENPAADANINVLSVESIFEIPETHAADEDTETAAREVSTEPIHGETTEELATNSGNSDISAELASAAEEARNIEEPVLSVATETYAPEQAAKAETTEATRPVREKLADESAVGISGGEPCADPDPETTVVEDTDGPASVTAAAEMHTVRQATETEVKGASVEPAPEEPLEVETHESAELRNPEIEAVKETTLNMPVEHTITVGSYDGADGATLTQRVSEAESASVLELKHLQEDTPTRETGDTKEEAAMAVTDFAVDGQDKLSEGKQGELVEDTPQVVTDHLNPTEETTLGQGKASEGGAFASVVAAAGVAAIGTGALASYEKSEGPEAQRDTLQGELEEGLDAPVKDEGKIKGNGPGPSGNGSEAFNTTAEPQATITSAEIREVPVRESHVQHIEADEPTQVPETEEHAVVAPEMAKPNQQAGDAEEGPSARIEPGAAEGDDGKGDESTSQNRSVTAVSLNSNTQGSWFKALLRALFTNFFGTMFSPFRRRDKRPR